MMKTTRISVLVPVVAALLAGCGSSGKSSSTATPATPPTQTTTSSSARSTTPSLSAAAIITTKHNKLGTVLAAGAKKLTVYLFEADTGATSTCTGACAKVWPPVTTSGQPRAIGQAAASQVSAIKRPDGTTQVAYDGHPLYFFKKDGDVSDAYGQRSKLFGAGWYVLAPSGKKIDKS